MTFIKSIRKALFIPFVMAGLLFVSCQDKDKKDTATEEAQAPTEMTLEQKKQQLNMAAPSSAPANVAANGGINPPHGQPGHRCDIPVGAPLDGSGNGKSMTITPTPAPTPPPAPQPVNTTTLASGTPNPAHGEPGHRCDVKVGDPLP